MQEWERERDDFDAEVSEEVYSGKKSRKQVDLVALSFKPEYAHIVIDHKLTDESERGNFEKYLIEKILLQKKHFPIEIRLPVDLDSLKSKERQAIMEEGSEIIKNLLPFYYFAPPNPYSAYSMILSASFQHLQNILPDLITKSNLKKIEKTTTEKNLLLPAQPNHLYEAFLEHRIDGTPFIITIFPF